MTVSKIEPTLSIGGSNMALGKIAPAEFAAKFLYIVKISFIVNS